MRVRECRVEGIWGGSERLREEGGRWESRGGGGGG